MSTSRPTVQDAATHIVVLLKLLSRCPQHVKLLLEYRDFFPVFIYYPREIASVLRERLPVRRLLYLRLCSCPCLVKLAGSHMSKGERRTNINPSVDKVRLQSPILFQKRVYLLLTELSNTLPLSSVRWLITIDGRFWTSLLTSN